MEKNNKKTTFYSMRRNPSNNPYVARVHGMSVDTNTYVYHYTQMNEWYVCDIHTGLSVGIGKTKAKALMSYITHKKAYASVRKSERYAKLEKIFKNCVKDFILELGE